MFTEIILSLSATARGAAPPSDTLDDLGASPNGPLLPELPPHPAFGPDGKPGFVTGRYHAGPTITTGQSTLTYQPYDAIANQTTGKYTTGSITLATGYQAFFSDGATAHAFGPPSDASGNTGFSTVGNGVNSLGQVVGAEFHRTSSIQTSPVAFVSPGGTETLNLLGNLGGPGSAANAINDAGQIVGNALTSAGAQHAFLYQSGVMTDLNASLATGTDWTLFNATDINNKGQILAEAKNSAGAIHDLLLTPNPVPVPEPSTVVLWGAAGLLAIARCRRQRSALARSA